MKLMTNAIYKKDGQCYQREKPQRKHMKVRKIPREVFINSFKATKIKKSLLEKTVQMTWSQDVRHNQETRECDSEYGKKKNNK